MHFKIILIALSLTLPLTSCSKSIDLRPSYDPSSETLHIGEFAIPKIIEKRKKVKYLGREFPVRLDEEVFISRDSTCYQVHVVKMTQMPGYVFTKSAYEALKESHPGTCSADTVANVRFLRCVVERPVSALGGVPYSRKSYYYYLVNEVPESNGNKKMFYQLPDEQCMNAIKSHIKQ